MTTSIYEIVDNVEHFSNRYDSLSAAAEDLHYLGKNAYLRRFDSIIGLDNAAVDLKIKNINSWHQRRAWPE